VNILYFAFLHRTQKLKNTLKYIIAGIVRIKHAFIFFVNVRHKHVIKNRKVHHTKGECF